jgi:hypothetical protein
MFSRIDVLNNQLAVSRAFQKKPKVIGKEAAGTDTKVFVGGLPNKATKGELIRRTDCSLQSIRIGH